MKVENEKNGMGIERYFHLVELAVLNPNGFSADLKKINLKKALLLFVANASLWLVLSASIRTLLIGKYHLFFAILSETLILVVPIFFGLLILACLLFLIAKIFGSRAKFRNNFKAVLYSTILMPFLAIPVFKILFGVVSFFLLIYCFKTANHFDRIKATISVMIPAGVLMFIIYMSGILNINLLIQ